MISWRTWVLTGGVIVSALFLDVLVLGVGSSDDGAAPVATSSEPSLPTPSTVVVGIGAMARPIPSVPVTVPLVVAEATSTTMIPAVVEIPISGAAAPVAPVVVAPAAAAPAAATPVARTPSPTAAAPSAPIATPGATATATPSATAPPTTEPRTTTTAPATTVATTPPTTVPSTTTTAPAVAASVEYVTYTASSGAGDIVLAVTADSLTLYGFYPNPNWISQTEENGPRTVKLKFFNTSTKRDAEWTATRESGRIQVEN